MKGTYLHFTIDLLTFPTLILNVEISFHIHSDLFFDTIDFSVRLTDRFTFDVSVSFEESKQPICSRTSTQSRAGWLYQDGKPRPGG